MTGPDTHSALRIKMTVCVGSEIMKKKGGGKELPAVGGCKW